LKGDEKMRLKNKVAIITAGGSGMGREGAVLFAKEGAKVVVADIDAQAAEETARMIEKNGGEPIFRQLDVKDLPNLKALIEETYRNYGRLDIIWNHAGIPGAGGFGEISEEEFDDAMNINTKSAFFGAQYFAELNKESTEGGSIIFTSSVSGLRGSPMSPLYSTCKGALVTLARSLAKLLGKYNIRVNVIAPGIAETPMRFQFLTRTPQDSYDDNLNMLLKQVAFGKLVDPLDVAYAALFFASDESKFITGVTLPVDGGYVA
jgi:NAD(P)-dependent dehydrogenase (short-subunit alcohol dehydrogenase family)